MKKSLSRLLDLSSIRDYKRPYTFGFAMLLISNVALAFTVFPLDSTHSEKWGSNANGTPGGAVTWGLIPVGTAGDPFCGPACPGVSQGSLNIENSPNGGYTLTPFASLVSHISAAFAKWSAVANIQFVGPTVDSGLAINNPAAISPDIRIGVFAFSSGGGAVGFAPPPNGGTGAGDILFDANSFYAFQPGNEGDLFPAASTAPNDFESLLLHEMGHALGLAHPFPNDGSCPVMQVGAACNGHISRVLKADDIQGAQFLYGAPVPAPAAVWLLASALAGVLSLTRIRTT